MIDYCKINKINYSRTFKEIASGIDLNGKEISRLIDDVLHYKIKSIYITNKDRLTRLSFKTLENIFIRFSTNVIVIKDDEDKDTNNKTFEELNLLFIYFRQKYIRPEERKN